MKDDQLRQKPFYLSESDISWVKETRNGLSLGEKVGQLFVVVQKPFSPEPEDLLSIKPGGMHLFAFSPDATFFKPMVELEAIKMRRLLLFFFVLTLLSGCSSITQESTTSMNQSDDKTITVTNKEWTYHFVVWDGGIYSTSEKVAKVAKEIGSVTKFSDEEGTYSDGFSNIFPVGTKLYEMPGVDTKKSIAIKTQDGTYVKADYQGKYGGK